MKLAFMAGFLFLGVGAAVAATGPIASGENQDGIITVGSTDSWTITAAVGDTLLFRIGKLTGGAGFTPEITLLSPSGTTLGNNWGVVDADLSHRATVAGAYSVVVKGRNNGDAGTYRLRALKVPGALAVPTGDHGGALTSGESHDGTIEVGDLDAWTVTAAAGDTMLFRIQELTGGNDFTARITLYGPDGVLRGDNWGGVVGSSRVDLQACKLEYSIVSPK